MPYQNSYIQLCKEHPRILLEKKDYIAHKWVWGKYFWNENPIALEIGTGMGNYFSYMVGKHADINFIWLELRYKRLYATARKAWEVCKNTSALTTSSAFGKLWVKKAYSVQENYLVLKCYGQDILNVFSENEISETYIYFPDPFYKKLKHKKHQLLSKKFLQDIYTCTKFWGELHFKTDHKEYFAETLEKIEKLWLWSIKFVTHDYKNSEIYNTSKITEFEWLFRGEQEDFYYVILEKK